MHLDVGYFVSMLKTKDRYFAHAAFLRENQAMNTAPESDGAALERLNRNIKRIEELSKRLVTALAARRTADHGLQGPGQDIYVKALAAYLAELITNPAKLIEHQINFWGQSLKHAVEAQTAMASGQPSAPPDEGPEDRRFSNPLWKSHPYFNFVKQQYQISSEAITNVVHDLEGLSSQDKKRLEFFSQQIIDLFAPTNFFATNPDALERAVETEGESLVKGLENLVNDIEVNHGDWLVTLSNRDAFEVGKNIGATDGAVVFRNRLIELIQYTPTTETVYRVPVVLFPPWINKFYILDLKAQNSLIKWIVDQGFTLFVVSWVNPDASFSDVGMDNYVEDGFLKAIEVVKEICAQPQVNAIGYCIAGTTLAITLALLQKRKDKSVKSATFFTALTDFSAQGEMGVFLGSDFVDAIEREVANKGYLDKFFMSRTFSYLRANDLIYGPAIKSYMLGESPPAFDLLYWNGDGTNLPGRMMVEYLEQLCTGDCLAQGTYRVFDETLSLNDIRIPLCAIACESDHIAAWKASYRGIQKMGSRNKTFILSQSGHIAGIVNPPSKNKYGHYIHDNLLKDAGEWHEAATFHPGSWWPRWEKWLKDQSGKSVSARMPGTSQYPSLAPAPGTYVIMQPET